MLHACCTMPCTPLHVSVLTSASNHSLLSVVYRINSGVLFFNYDDEWLTLMNCSVEDGFSKLHWAVVIMRFAFIIKATMLSLWCRKKCTILTVANILNVRLMSDWAVFDVIDDRQVVWQVRELGGGGLLYLQTAGNDYQREIILSLKLLVGFWWVDTRIRHRQVYR